MNFETMQIVFWYWWIAAVVFFILEMTIPAALFLWMGISALVVGLVSFVLDMMGTNLLITHEVILFSLLSMISVVWWKYRQKHKKTESQQNSSLNQRGAHYLHRELVLTNPIVNGYGREKVGSSYWAIKGPDAEKGARMRVVGHEGTILVVDFVEK